MSDNAEPRQIPEWLQSRPMDIPVTIKSVFTEPGPGAAQLTDGTPEQLAAWVEKRQAQLIELTGFDLRELPVSSEETTA